MPTKTILQEDYSLTKEQIAFYHKHRYIKLKHVLDNETLAYFNAIISSKVNELNEEDTHLENRSTYGKAFLQLFSSMSSIEHLFILSTITFVSL